MEGYLALTNVPQKRQSAAALQNVAVIVRRKSSLAFWSAALLRRFSKSIPKSEIVVFPLRLNHPRRMPESVITWPRAPTHQLSDSGTYFVTAGTYLKAHHFRSRERLDILQRDLLTFADDFGWEVEAWTVFSNHYHFVAHSPVDSNNANSLSKMLGMLHTRTAEAVNRLDMRPGRKVWHNYWDTKLSYHKSYLARLNYVHQNPVKHSIVLVANQYPWCSARWFEQIVSPAMVRSIYRFKTDALNVRDDFMPIAV